MPNSFFKDSTAVLDYKFDWSDWLPTGVSLTTYSLSVDTGITNTTSSFDSDSVTYWMSGGESGKTYNVSCRIETNATHEDKRTVRFHVRNR